MRKYFIPLFWGKNEIFEGQKNSKWFEIVFEKKTAIVRLFVIIFCVAKSQDLMVI